MERNINLEKNIHLPVSVLMPVCNEIDVIQDTVEEWHEEVFNHLPQSSELIFDDASTDGTFELLQKMQQKYTYIRIQHNAKKDGFFNSARRLYKLASCPLVFFTDSDGQYVPRDFWKLAPFIEHFDLIHGVKQNRKDPAHRLVASYFFNLIVRLLFKVRYSDINSAFRIIHRDRLIESLDDVKHMPTLLNAELLLRMENKGLRVKEIPVSHRSRKYGISRGLPLKRFFLEMLYAYRGLLKLKSEFQTEKKAASAFEKTSI